MPRPEPHGLPSRDQILRFITETDQPAGKREIARAFGLHGADKVALKALLKDMADEGLIDASPGRAFHQLGGLPKVTVLRVTDIDEEGHAVAVPERWEADGVPPPRVRVLERRGRGASALGVGDRFLARTEAKGAGHVAHPMKRLPRTEALVLGVVAEEGGALVLRPVDKRERRELRVADAGVAKPGDLVLAEPSGRPPRVQARVTEVLGDPFAPRAFSLIAIHKHGIPDAFAADTLAEADRTAERGLGEGREDLRALPIVAIDPRDARDHDDALWAEPDGEGGWRAVVAIADVSWYVRPGSELDREARGRGNSVYFPDRVVPMLPHALSSGMCSLKAGEDRAALACHLRIDAHGRVTEFSFARAVIRVVANIAYEDAQALVDAGEAPQHLQQLWGAWRALATARAARSPLELDLPERRVELDEAGRLIGVTTRERLDAHRLVEDFMIAANVAAAKALEAKQSPVMYRVHEPPTREKLIALRDFLATFEIPFALGQVIAPATFNRLLATLAELEGREQIMEQVLRTQTQAYYGPRNAGHFGLALGSYAHFTSPIRRYADLLVHRALVRAYALGEGGLSDAEAAGFERTAEAISRAERRAMEAERETLDRYVAAHLAQHVGEVVPARITGVQPFGFFATVEGVGGDGLVPVSTLGDDYFRWDEASQSLEGSASGVRFVSGQRLPLRLAEASPISGALRFELPDAPPSRGARPTRPPRGRPRNIRHDGKRRR